MKKVMILCVAMVLLISGLALAAGPMGGYISGANNQSSEPDDSVCAFIDIPLPGRSVVEIEMLEGFNNPNIEPLVFLAVKTHKRFVALKDEPDFLTFKNMTKKDQVLVLKTYGTGVFQVFINHNCYGLYLVIGVDVCPLFLPGWPIE